MMYKQLLWLTVVIVGLCGFAQAQDLIQISDVQTWENFGEGGFDAGDTLQILAGGDLTVSGRSAIKSGMQVMVEDGGAFTINSRLDLDEDGVITLNGGTFTCNGSFKFPDNATGMECHVWLYGGLMVCADTESRRDRGSTLHVGAGVFQTGDVTEGGRDDPSDTENWNIVAIPPYANVVITELEDGVKEVSAAGTLIQVSDEQVWDDFEAGGFGAGDRLEILAGGNLTVNGRSAIKDGMELRIQEGGIFTVNARLDIDGDGVITMNGGEFYSTVDLKFPDNATGLESHIWLYGGLMVCNRIDSRADRGSTLHVGEGVLRTGQVSESERYDPGNPETWRIVGIPPLGVVIDELEGDVKEVTGAGGIIQISDAQVWDDLESGGFVAGLTLQIIAGGSLEVNGRSAIKDGMHLIVENGGVFRINGRLDLDGDGVITINGGEFHSTVDLKFPDNDTGLEAQIWLNAGLMACNQIESRADRGSTLYLGAGMLRTGETYDIPDPNNPIDPNAIEPKLTDPNNIEAWNIVPVDPNTATLLTTLPNGYKMVTAPREVIQISDAQVWNTFADANFTAGDTLQILSGGSLEVNERSALKDGMHLIVDAGAVFTMNARMDMDSRGQIILNGGEIFSHGAFEFPDSSGNQDVDIWLDAGLMTCDRMTSRADRGSTLHVGEGILTLAQATGDQTDPTNELAWDIVSIPPYETIVITELDDGKTVLAELPGE